MPGRSCQATPDLAPYTTPAGRYDDRSPHHRRSWRAPRTTRPWAAFPADGAGSLGYAGRSEGGADCATAGGASLCLGSNDGSTFWLTLARARQKAQWSANRGPTWGFYDDERSIALRGQPLLAPTGGQLWLGIDHHRCPVSERSDGPQTLGNPTAQVGIHPCRRSVSPSASRSVYQAGPGLNPASPAGCDESCPRWHQK